MPKVNVICPVCDTVLDTIEPAHQAHGPVLAEKPCEKCKEIIQSGGEGPDILGDMD